MLLNYFMATRYAGELFRRVNRLKFNSLYELNYNFHTIGSTNFDLPRLRGCSFGDFQPSRSLGSSNSCFNGYVPRRAVMYVPGNDEKKIAKIPDIKADCIVFDCEDGVAESKKDEARSVISSALDGIKKQCTGKDCAVRINGVETKHFHEDVYQLVVKSTFDTVFLPKIESRDHIDEFLEEISSLKCTSQKFFKLVIYIESAKGLLNLPDICRFAREKQGNDDIHYTLEGIVFGSDDYCADIGATRTSGAKEVLYARQHVVAVAKSFGLQAIDVVYIDYKDLEGLKVQSEEGAQFGFTGKQVIHPSQVDIVQNAFSPSSEKIVWAKNLVQAFEQHQKEGKGAFAFEGSMIDRPLLLQAENILKLASRCQ